MNPHPHSVIRNPQSRWLLLGLLLLSSFLVRHSSLAQSASPLVIPFQGQVTTQPTGAAPTGAPVATGQYSLIFNLYDVAVGGQPVWTERHSKVGVVNGMVNVFLGSITPLTAVDFSQNRYLGITVDVDDKPTTADPEMVPRQMIIPAFYAKVADSMTAFNSSTGQSLGTSYGWSAVFNNGDPVSGRIDGARLADNGITTSKIADGQITTSKLSVGVALPPGSVIPYAGATSPSGYLLCDGSVVSTNTYASLFLAIGSTYNTGGEGAGNFRLPDLRGRTPIGAGQGSLLTNRLLGERLGEEQHLLTELEMPSHTHNVRDLGHAHPNKADWAFASSGAAAVRYIVNTGAVNAATNRSTTYPLTDTATADIAEDSKGGGLKHNVMQPSIVLNYIIKF
jgi:microcystin-dependent protein